MGSTGLEDFGKCVSVCGWGHPKEVTHLSWQAIKYLGVICPSIQLPWWEKRTQRHERGRVSLSLLAAPLVALGYAYLT